MLGMNRKSRIDKVREALKEAASYTDGIVHDRRLRADLRAASSHGAVAMKRVGRDIRGGRGTMRIASDKKLRKSLRAFVDDVVRANTHMQRRKSHRVRNALLLVGGTGAAVAAATQGRRWLRARSANEMAMPATAH
jgi:hypothetical protein